MLTFGLIAFLVIFRLIGFLRCSFALVALLVGLPLLFNWQVLGLIAYGWAGILIHRTAYPLLAAVEHVDEAKQGKDSNRRFDRVMLPLGFGLRQTDLCGHLNEQALVDAGGVVGKQTIKCAVHETVNQPWVTFGQFVHETEAVFRNRNTTATPGGTHFKKQILAQTIPIKWFNFGVNHNATVQLSE